MEIKYKPNTKKELKALCDDLSVNLGEIDTSKITDMSCLFSNNYMRKYYSGIENWNVSNVTNMGFMFFDAINFNQDIGNWDVSNVTSMEGMFSGAINFSQALPNWNVSKNTDIYEIFYNADLFNKKYGSVLHHWDWWLKCKYYEKFGDTQEENNMSSNEKSRILVLKAENDEFNRLRNLPYHPTTHEELVNLVNDESVKLKDIDTSKITDMSHLFKDAYNRTDLNDIADWNVSNVTDMSYMFTEGDSFNGDGADNSTFNADLSKWNVSKVTNMMYAFRNCLAFEGKGLENWDVSNVRNMWGMFGAYNGGDEDCALNCDLSQWNVDNVTDMTKMFEQCDKFNCNLSNWDVSNVTYMGYMFRDCKKFEGAGLENWNVSKVTEMSEMFDNCVNFDCDLSNWDVSNVTEMHGTFWGNDKFKGVGLENWDVSKVVNFEYFLNACRKLKDDLDLSSWNIRGDACLYGCLEDSNFGEINCEDWKNSWKEFVNKQTSNEIVFDSNLVYIQGFKRENCFDSLNGHYDDEYGVWKLDPTQLIKADKDVKDELLNRGWFKNHDDIDGVKFMSNQDKDLLLNKSEIKLVPKIVISNKR